LHIYLEMATQTSRKKSNDKKHTITPRNGAHFISASLSLS